MKMSVISLLSIIFIFILFSANSSAETLSDTTKIDTSKQQIIESDTSIIYTKVDVVVQSDWGDPEKTEDVVAEILLKDGKPVKVVFKGVRHKTCEVTLMAGLSVKIYDHQAGKLLKTVKGQ